jgi:hypothetical protein
MSPFLIRIIHSMTDNVSEDDSPLNGDLEVFEILLFMKHDY